MVLRIIITVVFFTVFQLSASSNRNDGIVDDIFTLIYNQQFNTADSALSAHKGKITAFYYDILKIDLLWWKYCTTRSREDAHKLTSFLDNFNKSVANGQEGKIEQLIKKSYQLRYKHMRHNIIGAIIIRSNVNKLIKGINKDVLPIPDNRLKLYNLYIALFQYSDNIFNPFFKASNSEKRSNSLLLLEKYTQENDLVIKTLSHYFLGKIYLEIERDPQKGKTHFEILSINFPNNTLFIAYSEKCNMKQ